MYSIRELMLIIAHIEHNKSCSPLSLPPLTVKCGINFGQTFMRLKRC